MIRVEVEGYCQKCMDFVPDVTPPARAISDVDGEVVYQSDTIIQCKHRRRCAAITRYLEHQIKGDVDNHE